MKPLHKEVRHEPPDVERRDALKQRRVTQRIRPFLELLGEMPLQEPTVTLLCINNNDRRGSMGKDGVGVVPGGGERLLVEKLAFLRVE